MAKERDKLVFDSLDASGGNSVDTDLDVNVFFDMMESMVNEYYDTKEGAAHGNYQAAGILAYSGTCRTTPCGLAELQRICQSKR